VLEFEFFDVDEAGDGVAEGFGAGPTKGLQ
jgi:hypothetical protein